MENKKQIALLLTTALLATSATFLIVAAPNRSENINVEATQTTTTISKEKLNSIDLIDYEIKGHTDKKFTITLDNGKYIEGAVLFGDCSYQSAPAKLGGMFQMDNSEQDGKNNANFNFLFNVHGIITIQYNFTFSLDKALVDDDQAFDTDYSIKFAYEGRNSSIYDELTSFDYDKLVCGYTTGAIYDEGGSQKQRMNNGESSKTIPHSMTRTGTKDFSIVATQVNAFNVPAGFIYYVQLNSIELTYSC